ncbi:MAG TPA: protein kinase [Polyangiaceae bacterium]|nr:protein kinase [Polyangiaceae bacterium]
MAADAFGIVGAVIASTYHVESVVAEGGFGTVYRAHHGGFRAPVALKCLRLPPGLLPEARQRFLDSFRAEAELLFKLSASIQTVVRPLHVDAFTLPDGCFVPYMVLEWLEGSTLDALIRKRKRDGQAPFPVKKLVRLLTPVARALERAHNFRGPEGQISIVHRDLKPENIFVANVADEEVIKILDFGIAKAKSVVSQVAGRVSQGAAGIATFTPAYGSPEQWAPKRYGQTGPWTDVWGLALTMTEALVGRPIIDGEPAAIMGAILDANRRPTPGSEGVIVSDEVEAVFEKALALDPRDRHADAGVFWNELLAAARITSGELQEVRMPRDSRAEPGGGVLVERVERVEVARRLPSARPPGGPAPVAPMATLAQRPTLDLPPLASAGPAIESTAALQGAAAQDLELELRPLGPAPVPFPPAVSGAFEVPDLDLAPVSRAPVPPRTSSGLRAAVAPALDDLEDHRSMLSTDPEAMPSTGLDLDLVPGEVPGRSSYPPLPVSQAPQRAQTSLSPRAGPASQSGPAPPSNPRAPQPSNPSLSPTPPPAGMGASLPPIVSAPPPAGSLLPAGSLPPPSRGAGQSPLPLVSVPAPKPALQIHFAPHDEPATLERLKPGLTVLALGTLMIILEVVYSAATGDVFSIGPLRTSILAAILMVVGVLLCVFRVIKRS